MKTYTPDELKCRNILHAKRGETTLEALQRHMTKHKKTVQAFHLYKMHRRKRSWHGLFTINRVAVAAGVCRTTVKRDMERELITPLKLELISGRWCHVFTEKEVRQYKDYRDTVVGGGKPHRWEKITKSANTVGVEETARLFDIKPASVRKMLERHKVKLIPLEDILSSAMRVHRVHA